MLESADGARTPYELVTRARAAEATTKRALIARCRRLEREALDDPPVAVRATLQDARHVTEATLAVYADLAARGVDVTLFARGLRAWLAPGVRGVALEEDDPLGDVWSLVVVSPTRPVALAALDLFTHGNTDAERPFRVAVSRDPSVVAACAQLLGPSPVSAAAGPGKARP